MNATSWNERAGQMALQVYIPACSGLNADTINLLIRMDTDLMIHFEDSELLTGTWPWIQSILDGGAEPSTKHVRVSLVPKGASVLFGIIETGHGFEVTGEPESWFASGVHDGGMMWQRNVRKDMLTTNHGEVNM